jgi:hypothetical protein
MSILWGCWLDFTSGFNGLAVCWYDTQPVGLHVSHTTWLINVKKMEMENKYFHKIKGTKCLPIKQRSKLFVMRAWKIR